MALTTCTECKREISTEAATCPGCGYEQRRGGSTGVSGTDPVHMIGVILCIGFLAVVVTAAVHCAG